MADGSTAVMLGEVKKALTGVLMLIACIINAVSLKGATGFIAGIRRQR